MERMGKSFAYLGFAIKAGKLRTGINAINTLKNDVYLIIVCSTGEKNARKEAEKLSVKFNAPLIESVTKTLEEITGKENCKVAAVTDENLSKAILQNLGEDFRVLNGGHKD